MFRSILLSAVVIGFVTALAGGARADLVNNGNFTTGDFTGWTVTGDSIGIDSTFANTGDVYDAFFSADVGDPSAGVLSQAIATTPGAGYDLSFALLDEAGFSGDSFTVGFGDFSTTITGDQASPYQDGVDLYTAEAFPIPGAAIIGVSTVLSLQGLDDPISGIDWNLDDISLTAGPSLPVPEPATVALFATALTFGLGLRLLARGQRRA